MNVLFVDTIVIGEHSATGSTLANITCGINDCNFLQYCIDYDSKYHSPIYPTIYESKKNNFLFFIIKSVYRFLFATSDSAGTNVVNISTKGNSFKSLLKCLLDCIPHYVSKKNIQEIKKFKPDLIYSLGGSITTLRVTYMLSKKLSCPIVLHFMDDWYDTNYLDCKYTRWANAFVKKYADKVLSNSFDNLAISEKMANHYSEKFGKSFGYAMNCIGGLHLFPKNKNNELRFVFSGGLHGGREKSLMFLGTIIKEQNLSDKISFEIYTSKYHIEQYGAMLSKVAKVYEYVPEERMFENIGTADVLVHVESFEQNEIDFYRYSLSTKIPEYLSVGRPILCFGPREIGTVSYIEEKKVGVVAENKTELKSALLKLINESSYYCFLADNAKKIAENEHLKSAVAFNVKRIFTESVSRFLQK